MKRHQGFSLLELLIVVAIILIISTIAIPSFLRSRQSANESSAVANMRTLNTAQVSYSSANGGAYGTIPALISAGLTDTRFTGPVSGYAFTVTTGSGGLDYTMEAIASSANSGRYDYYTTPDYVIRYSSAPTRAPNGLAGEPVR